MKPVIDTTTTTPAETPTGGFVVTPSKPSVAVVTAKQAANIKAMFVKPGGSKRSVANAMDAKEVTARVQLAEYGAEIGYQFAQSEVRANGTFNSAAAWRGNVVLGFVDCRGEVITISHGAGIWLEGRAEVSSSVGSADADAGSESGPSDAPYRAWELSPYVLEYIQQNAEDIRAAMDARVTQEQYSAKPKAPKPGPVAHSSQYFGKRR